MLLAPQVGMPVGPSSRRRSTLRRPLAGGHAPHALPDPLGLPPRIGSAPNLLYPLVHLYLPTLLQAAQDITEGERLCTIPKAACLSIRTTQLADVIEAEELGGGLGLVLAVLHEMSLGPDSKW